MPSRKRMVCVDLEPPRTTVHTVCTNAHIVSNPQSAHMHTIIHKHNGEIRGRRRPTEVATTSRAEALPENPAGLLLPNTDHYAGVPDAGSLRGGTRCGLTLEGSNAATHGTCY